MTDDPLTFDEKMHLACIRAGWCEIDPIVTDTDGSITTHWDAIGWACWDSVSMAVA